MDVELRKLKEEMKLIKQRLKQIQKEMIVSGSCLSLPFLLSADDLHIHMIVRNYINELRGILTLQ
jgi:hypothetical protein